MKVLLDENITQKSITILEKYGHEYNWKISEESRRKYRQYILCNEKKRGLLRNCPTIPKESKYINHIIKISL